MSILRRLMGRSVQDLAGEVDEALGRLASAQHQRAVAEESLEQAKNLEAQCHREVDAARDALFNEHPALAPKGWREPTMIEKRVAAETAADTPPGAWDPEVVEVDDENDSRFTAGASPVSANDSEPLPPIEWNERDG